MTSRALISRRRVRLASRCSPPHTADGSPPADHITRPPAYRLGGTGSARVPGQRDQLRANWIENPRCIAQLEPGGSKSGGHPKGPGDRNLGSARGRENHLWVSTFSQAAGHAPLLTLPSIQLAANCLREAKGVVWVGRSLPILVSFGTRDGIAHQWCAQMAFILSRVNVSGLLCPPYARTMTKQRLVALSSSPTTCVPVYPISLLCCASPRHPAYLRVRLW